MKLYKSSLIHVMLSVLFFNVTPSLAQPTPTSTRESFDSRTVLEAGTALLEMLQPVAVFEHVHGKEGEKRELKGLLGDEGGPYARLVLHPETLEPIPLGLEEFAPPVAAALAPNDVMAVLPDLIQTFSLSSLVVPEKDGFKLFLVYDGYMVGELKLTKELQPRYEEKWLKEYERSRWRYP